MKYEVGWSWRRVKREGETKTLLKSHSCLFLINRKLKFQNLNLNTDKYLSGVARGAWGRAPPEILKKYRVWSEKLIFWPKFSIFRACRHRR